MISFDQWSTSNAIELTTVFTEGLIRGLSLWVVSQRSLLALTKGARGAYAPSLNDGMGKLSVEKSWWKDFSV